MEIPMYCYCGDNTKYGLLSKKLLQRKQQNDGWENLRVIIKFIKTVTSSHHVEWRTFTEAIYINNIHTRENAFSSCYFCKFLSFFVSDRVKNLVYTLVFDEPFWHF